MGTLVGPGIGGKFAIGAGMFVGAVGFALLDMVQRKRFKLGERFGRMQDRAIRPELYNDLNVPYILRRGMQESVLSCQYAKLRMTKVFKAS